MESGIQQAISLIEAGQAKQALPVLQGLLKEEETEEEEMSAAPEGEPSPATGAAPGKAKIDFRQMIAKHIQPE